MPVNFLNTTNKTDNTTLYNKLNICSKHQLITDFVSVYQTNIDWHKVNELSSTVKEAVNGTILSKLNLFQVKTDCVFVLLCKIWDFPGLALMWLFSNYLSNLKANDCNSDVTAHIFSPQTYEVVSSA